MTKQRVLVLMFHPKLEQSRVNRLLCDNVHALPEVTYRDMYEYYPDLMIDVPLEQKFLEEHDVVVWQHPFYWYSCPPLLKQWIDLVLTPGWAYGAGGTALSGKKLIQVFSSGGDFAAYDPAGRNQYTYRELLRPFELTAKLCHMMYMPPLVVPGAMRLSPEQLDEYADMYRRLLVSLHTGHVPDETWQSVEYAHLLLQSPR